VALEGEFGVDGREPLGGWHVERADEGAEVPDVHRSRVGPRRHNLWLAAQRLEKKKNKKNTENERATRGQEVSVEESEACETKGSTYANAVDGAIVLDGLELDDGVIVEIIVVIIGIFKRE
jgi:hypothetical protein